MAGAFAYQHDVAYPEFDRWLMQMTTYLAFTHLIAGVGDLPKIWSLACVYDDLLWIWSLDSEDDLPLIWSLDSVNDGLLWIWS